MLGRIIIAVDHADATLERYLSDFVGCENIDKRLLRRSLAIAAMSGGADGVVVAPTDVAWALERIERRAVIIGGPDIPTHADVHFVVETIRRRTKSRSVGLPVKLGLYVPSADVSLGASLRPLAEMPDLAVIVEPYFGADVSVRDRVGILEEAAQVSVVVAFKLDLEAPEQTASAYSEAVGPIPWFARSDGLDFATFASRIQFAASRGCSGAIVGAAVWRSEISSAVGMAPTSAVINARIEELRTILHDY